MNDLCNICGASWACEHKRAAEVERYIDDPYGPPVAKLITVHEQPSQLRLAEYLRRVAQAIDAGTLPATGVIVIVSEGDIHRPFLHGYSDWRQVHAASNALFEEQMRQSGHGRSAEENAAGREANRQRAIDEREDYLVAHPWVCSCSKRFATSRGRQQHFNTAKRRGSNADKHHAP